jgi:ribosomal-protein-alanine N-acetyltransferase
VRVAIAHPTLADGDDFCAAMRASRALHRPWIAMPEDSEAYAAYVRRFEGERAVGYLARRTDTGAVVGFANVSEIIRGKLNAAFLGYGGVAGQTGQGFMREALELVVADALGSVGLHRIEANIQPANTASIALAASVGFEREGFSPRYLIVDGAYRDHERWAIDTERWQARAQLANRRAPA